MPKELFNLGATPSLKQQVYDILRMRIITGALAPGAKLHEEELSNEMGISRAPLREALNMLDRDGFARIIPRRGAVVTEITPEDICMLWDIRELLEPHAAVMSVENIPAKELQMVRQNLEHVLENPDDFESYMESDIEVHALLTDYLDNHYLSDILKNVKEHSLRMRWNAERQTFSDSLDIIIASVEEHIAIIEAIEAKDVDQLYRAVQIHIQESKKRTLLRFNRDGS